MGLEVTGRYRYPSPAPEWLAQRIEPVIEPGLRIIDAHHHLWVENGNPYLLDELVADVSAGHRIAATIVVQAHYGYRETGPDHLRPVGETERVAAIAAEARDRSLGTQVAAGIVAYANLTLGDQLGEVLDAHTIAARGALRGIRHSVSRDEHFPDGVVIRPAPAGLLADPRYRSGLSTLVEYGLSYDAMLYHAQIPELAAMARALPDLQIILDHIGCILGVGYYRGRGDENFAAWRAAMTELARCPNVVVKFGGFGMIVGGANWHERPLPPTSTELADAWRRYFETCIELFGVERCMFESNVPVDKAMYSYRTLWNAFKRLGSGASPAEKEALFAGTAAKVYRVDPAAALLSVVARG